MERKVPQCHSGFCPSEIELPEWCFGAFRNKNTPASNKRNERQGFNER
jgi:hypothetical protein